MINLIGTYECKIDVKGRLLLPVNLKKQLGDHVNESFIVRRSVFQNCLELHPFSEWKLTMEKINKLNKFVKKTNDYIRMNNEKIEGIALPIAGKGLWSTIFGYIALNPDTDSVLGIQFYKHGETPGLGGEVEKKWFTDNFVNHPIKESNGEITYVPKKIRNENGKIISISVIKGGVDYSKSNKSAIHQVDGISGATVTADGVSDFLLEDLLRYEKTLDKIRDYGTI